MLLETSGFKTFGYSYRRNVCQNSPGHEVQKLDRTAQKSSIQLQASNRKIIQTFVREHWRIADCLENKGKLLH